jgi:16S rRNA (cytidine1402-2'-O)-methyltransferase
MPLHLVAVPIGDAGDISLRAIETLKRAEIVIGEERKEASKLLKFLGIEPKRIELLNEHSREADIADLLELCKTHQVALVTDCGTPGFCDPGAQLVQACRQANVTTSPVPGASSLMCLLSVSGLNLREFLFRGFLPAEREARSVAMRDLDREITGERGRVVILMDTPYRLGRLLVELSERWPENNALLGCDFTQSTETVIETRLKNLPEMIGERKAEFIIAIFPKPSASSPRKEKITSFNTTAVRRSNRQ